MFCHWGKYYSTTKIETDEGLLCSILWYNVQISKKMLYYPDWFKGGINIIGDIVNHELSIYSITELEQMYNININFLNYLTINKCVTEFIRKSECENTLNFARPYIPFHLKPIISKS